MLSESALKTAQILSAISFMGMSSDQNTPWDLAVEMVDEIPAEYFNVETLVPGSGFGVFALALIYRGWDAAKITCVELDPRFAVITEKWIGRFGVRVIVDDFLTSDPMKCDVIIANPPYQAPKTEGKKGPGGDNALFVKFINHAADLINPGGFISMVTPPSALTKSTVNGRPTKTLQKLLDRGAIVSLDLDAGSHFNVGTAISRWTFIEGQQQGRIRLTKDGETTEVSIEDLYFCPPKFEWVEFNLFNKILSNREGTPLNVTRGKPGRDFTMKRLGYPKIEKGGNNALGFDAEHAEFLQSQLGLWLLDYIRRHDQFIYHGLLTGIHVPSNGFELTPEENAFISSRHWPNFSVGS